MGTEKRSYKKDDRILIPAIVLDGPDEDGDLYVAYADYEDHQELFIRAEFVRPDTDEVTD